MRWTIKAGMTAAGVIALSGCSMFETRDEGLKVAPVDREVATDIQRTAAVSDYPVLLGEPYSIGSVKVQPEDVLSYDQVGYAGVYSPDNGRTATGEAFKPMAVTGAHKTLPVPTYVEVTALETGRTILVRLNDRGPMANDRLLALSPGAAQQLGLPMDRYAPVRVRRVNPPEQERVALRSGARAAERLDTPDPLLAVLRKRLGAAPKGVPAPVLASAPAAETTSSGALPQPSRQGNAPGVPWQKAKHPVRTTSDDGFIIEDAGLQRPGSPERAARATVPRPVVVSGSGGFVVQLGAFSSRANADALARRAGGVVDKIGSLWRVRTGPYATRQAADSARNALSAKGFAQARVMSR